MFDKILYYIYGFQVKEGRGRGMRSNLTKKCCTKNLSPLLAIDDPKNCPSLLSFAPFAAIHVKNLNQMSFTCTNLEIQL